MCSRPQLNVTQQSSQRLAYVTNVYKILICSVLLQISNHETLVIKTEAGPFEHETSQKQNQFVPQDW